MSSIYSYVPSAIAEFAYPVSDLAGLRAVSAFNRIDKQARLVEDKGAIYYFNAEGTGVDDGDGIIKPDDVFPFDPGRWFKMQGSLQDHQALLSLQGGNTTERYHITQAQNSGLALKSDIAVDGNLSSAARDAISKKHSQNTDTGTSATNFAINGNNAIKEGDSRLTNDRTPVAHASSHNTIGSDPVTITPTQAGLGTVTNDAQLKRAAGDFASFDPKIVIASADLILIEDSEDTGKKKKITSANLSCRRVTTVTDIDNLSYQGDALAAQTVDTNAFGLFANLFIAADGHYDEATADASTHCPVVAMALETGTGSKKILLRGYVRNDSWTWTTGPGIASLIYLSPATAGGMTQTRPSVSGQQIQILGYAISATVIYFNPNLMIVEVP